MPYLEIIVRISEEDASKMKYLAENASECIGEMLWDDIREEIESAIYSADNLEMEKDFPSLSCSHRWS
jgi:hypothetical protein